MFSYFFQERKIQRHRDRERATTEIWQKSFPFQPGTPGTPTDVIALNAGQAAEARNSATRPPGTNPGHNPGRRRTHDHSAQRLGHRPRQATVGRALSQRVGSHRPPTRQRDTERRPTAAGEDAVPGIHVANATRNRHRRRRSAMLEGSGRRPDQRRRGGLPARPVPPPRSAAGSRPRRSERRPHRSHVGAAQIVGSGTHRTTKEGISWP